ncbi:MAG TPA: RHS repeat-associated core domain-containing protein [Thermoanaerobaculia bacterium]
MSYDRGAIITAAYNHLARTAILYISRGPELRAPTPAGTSTTSPATPQPWPARNPFLRVEYTSTAAELTPATPSVQSRIPYPGDLTRHYVYTPELNLLAETTFSTVLGQTFEYEYIWFAGQPLAQITTATQTTHWYLPDHLGTPILQTDETATVVWRAEYTPYGPIHTYRTGIAKHQPLRFPGQEATVGRELSYNIFRWYRGGWGRYTQSDPIGLNGGLNMFVYVIGNPVTLGDRIGAAPEFPQFPKTHRGPCYSEEWKYCEKKCSPQPVDGCYVITTSKLITTRGFPQLEPKRNVECNCRETSCEKPLLDKLKDWWTDSTRSPGPPVFPVFPVLPTMPARAPGVPGIPPGFVNPCWYLPCEPPGSPI